MASGSGSTLNPGGGPIADGGGPVAGPPRGYALSGKIMLMTIVALFSIVLLLLFLHLYLRWRLLRRTSLIARHRRHRRHRRHLVFAGDGHIPHPAVTFTRGLERDVLKSLPVVVFSAASADGEAPGDGEEGAATECAVCLSEFLEGEKLRLLPRCGHRFHTECIDMWFGSHATCPLCRSAVEAGAAPPPATADPSPSSARAVVPLPAERLSDGIGSSSSSACSGEGELRIQVAARGSDEEAGLGPWLESGSAKSPGGSRILLLRRLLSGDLTFYRVGGSPAESDLERGEAAERPPSPPPPPPPPPPPAR